MITFTVEISQRQVEAGVNEAEQRIIQVLSDEAMPRLIDFVEDTQIKKYTTSGNPALPPASEYTRTFELRDSSDRRLDGLNGEWFTDLDYARWVLGSEVEQAAIHRGRWKSKEQVEAELEANGDRIINEALKESGI